VGDHPVAKVLQGPVPPARRGQGGPALRRRGRLRGGEASLPASAAAPAAPGLPPAPAIEDARAEVAVEESRASAARAPARAGSCVRELDELGPLELAALLDDACGGRVGSAVHGVGADAAITTVEGEDVRTAEEVGLADDARTAEGVSAAHNREASEVTDAGGENPPRESAR
jgi:hypothetical protein